MTVNILIPLVFLVPFEPTDFNDHLSTNSARVKISQCYARQKLTLRVFKQNS